MIDFNWLPDKSAGEDIDFVFILYVFMKHPVKNGTWIEVYRNSFLDNVEDEQERVNKLNKNSNIQMKIMKKTITLENV